MYFVKKIIIVCTMEMEYIFFNFKHHFIIINDKEIMMNQGCYSQITQVTNDRFFFDKMTIKIVTNLKMADFDGFP